MSSSTSEYARESGFPTFTAAFERETFSEYGVKAYHAMLGPGGLRQARIAGQIIGDCVAASPQPDAEIKALFAEPNWRPQIVGATALLVRPDLVTEKTLASLWAAFDSGSWVSPQLAATAYLNDPAFAVQARLRIEAGCPIQKDRLAGLDWPERHSSAGPGGFSDHSNKALAALVALCGMLVGSEADTSWLHSALADPAIQSQLADDKDGGDRIAVQWLEGVREVLKRMGDSK